MDTPKPRKTSKKETVQKRQTRSRHEKKRREEMNQVLSEMMTLLPEGIGECDTRREDQKRRQPDKCFIIGNAAEIIRRSLTKSPLLSDSVTKEIFNLTDTFLITLNNFIVSDIIGDHRFIFDVEVSRMIGKDIRCYLDFESGSKLSFLNFTPAHPISQEFQLKSFLAKSMTCRVKNNEQNPSEMMMICVPNIINTVFVPTGPSPPPPSKLAAERPILAALLQKKDPPIERRIEETPQILTNQKEPKVELFSDATSSTSKASTIKKKPVKKVSPMRKRLRSVNATAIVESFPLDEPSETIKKPKLNGPPNFSSSASTSTFTTPPIPVPTSSVSTTVTMPTLVYPINTSTSIGALNPYDVLTPGYRDIWLRLQSERLLLEKRIVAKEGELKNLMLTAQTLPQYIPPSQFFTIPQYSIAPNVLDVAQPPSL